MARPIKVGLDYFPMDTNFLHDPKIAAMRARFGNDAIAFWTVMLCQVYATKDAKLSLVDKDIRAVMAALCMLDDKRFESLLALALKLGLFDAATYRRSTALTSDAIQRRLKGVNSKRERWRKNRAKELSTETTPTVTRQRKGKESKEKQNRKAKVVDVIMPERLVAIEGFTEAWTLWLKQRSELNKKLTPTTQQRQLKFLATQPDPIACIYQSIDRGWMGLFELKGGSNGAAQSTRTTGRATITKESILSVAEQARRINEAGNL